MKIGSHVSNNGSEMLLGSVKEALSYEANCFMVYLGAPQNTFRKLPQEMNIDAMQDLMKEHKIQPEDVIVHAPYIVNLAQPDVEKWQYAIRFLTQEVKLTAAICAKYLVLHPGAHVGTGSNNAILRIASGIKRILENTKDTNVMILLETMAGKGTEVGRTFQEIREIMDEVASPRMGVCLDTCHIHDAGYDIVYDYEGTLQLFDQVIGFNHLKVIHLNDSKNPFGAHKDRHENIGLGMIGFETLAKFAHDERFYNIPKILETPYIEGEGDEEFPPYREEIAMLRKNEFNPNLKSEIITKNKQKRFA